MKNSIIFPAILGLVLSACSLDVFLDDGSNSLRSGPGNDPVLRIQVVDGQVLTEPDSSDIPGTYTVGSDFISLQMGDVLVVNNVMPAPSKGTTIAIEYSQHDLDLQNSAPGHLYTILYRPDSPVKLSFATRASGMNYDRAGLSYGTLSEQNDVRPRLSSTGAWGSFEGNDEGVPGESEPQWAAVTINRDGIVRFFLQGQGFSENSLFLDDYTRQFGALALLPYMGGQDDLDMRALATETKMDPINRPLTNADPEQPERFEVRTVLVFDYALTPKQLLALPQL